MQETTTNIHLKTSYEEEKREITSVLNDDPKHRK